MTNRFFYLINTKMFTNLQISYSNSVRPSVCLSWSDIVSKRLNVGQSSYFLQHTVALAQSF